jgi:hypothetical protein
MSIALDGQALNITLATGAHSLDLGLIGCRRSVPHLQHLLAHLETALKELECAAGL